ncbi:MAG: recombinase family protein [Nanoarchaeota archaeon]
MVCAKCGYSDKKETEKNGLTLCRICSHFAPEFKQSFDEYVSEKIDWRIIDTFRKFGQSVGEKLKQGMDKKANYGCLVTRAPWGYNVIEGKLIPNEDASKVHSLFKTFLEKDYSLNSLSKHYGLSVNGIKKVLTNRTYLGEIKFAGKLNKGLHAQIISPEIFYAVQRKLKEKLKPQKDTINGASL